MRFRGCFSVAFSNQRSAISIQPKRPRRKGRKERQGTPNQPSIPLRPSRLCGWVVLWSPRFEFWLLRGTDNTDQNQGFA